MQRQSTRQNWGRQDKVIILALIVHYSKLKRAMAKMFELTPLIRLFSGRNAGVMCPLYAFIFN